MQQEAVKFNDICASLNSPKTELEANFLDLENRSFEKNLFCSAKLVLQFISFIGLRNIHKKNTDVNLKYELI